MGAEREHEVLAQSRKVRRQFSLSKSFTEQLSFLIKFCIWEKSDTIIIHLFSMIHHYIIVLIHISILCCNVLTLLKQIIIFLLVKTTSETKCSEGSKLFFFSSFGIAWQIWECSFTEEKKITLCILEFLTRSTIRLYYMNPQRINKHLNQSWLNKLWWIIYSIKFSSIFSLPVCLLIDCD